MLSVPHTHTHRYAAAALSLSSLYLSRTQHSLSHLHSVSLTHNHPPFMYSTLLFFVYVSPSFPRPITPLILTHKPLPSRPISFFFFLSPCCSSTFFSLFPLPYSLSHSLHSPLPCLTASLWLPPSLHPSHPNCIPLLLSPSRLLSFIKVSDTLRCSQGLSSSVTKGIFTPSWFRVVTVREQCHPQLSLRTLTC